MRKLKPLKNNSTISITAAMPCKSTIMIKYTLMFIPLFCSLTSSGQFVGIGTTSPTKPLTIQGDINNNLLSFKNNQGTEKWHWWMPDGSTLSLTESNVQDYRLTIKAGGNIGISHSNPVTRLHVNSTPSTNVALFETNGGWGQILVGNGTIYSDLGADETKGYCGSGSDHDFSIRTGGDDRIFIKHNSGYVGLGSTTPNHMLDIQANSNMTIAAFRNTNSENSNIVITNATSAVDFGLNGVGGYIGSVSAGDFRIRTNYAVRMFFRHADGFVGINTEYPLQMLDVNGNIALSGNIIVDPPTHAILLNGWIIYDNAFGIPQYSKDKQGRVLISGLAEHTPVNGGHIFTLPAGYRPEKSMFFLAASDHPNGFSKVLINHTNGEVSVSSTESNITWVSFDNIVFRGI
jgi:hypothetical protein